MNQFRKERLEEEVAQEARPDMPEKAELPRNFFTTLFTEGVISKEAATDMLPFVVYIAMLGMLYIANQHFAVNNVRDIDKLNKEVKELSWDYKTLKAELMQKSTQSEVAKLVDTIGLKEPVEPPKRIVLVEEEE